MGRPRTPLPRQVVQVARRQGGLVGAWQLQDAGVNRQRVARLVSAGVLLRVSRRVYDVVDGRPAASTPGEQLDHNRLRAACFGVLAHGPTAVATGISALVLLGVKGAPRRFTPEVALPHSGPVRGTDGVRVRRMAVAAVRRVNGISTVTPEVAIAQAVPELDRNTAVAMLDSARSRGILTERALARARAHAVGRRGVARTWVWWDLSDPRSESPMETRARLTCADAGFPPDVVQLTILDEAGVFLARVDLAWRLPDGRWLLGEIDGVDFHSGRRDVHADLERQNRIVTAETMLRRWTGAQAADGTVAREVAAILRCAAWRPPTKPLPDTLVLRRATADVTQSGQ